MSHEALSGLQFHKYMARDRYPGTDHLADEHVIEAHHPEHGIVGEIAIRARAGGGRPAGHVDDVSVDDQYQRRGVGTALWNHANELADKKLIPRPKHSPQRTYPGDQWARKVGGKLPKSPEHPR